MHCNQEQIEALLDGELTGPEGDAVLAHLRIVPAAAATTGSCWPWSRPCGRYRSRPGGLACGYHEPGP